MYHSGLRINQCFVYCDSPGHAQNSKKRLRVEREFYRGPTTLYGGRGVFVDMIVHDRKKDFQFVLFHEKGKGNRPQSQSSLFQKVELEYTFFVRNRVQKIKKLKGYIIPTLRN